VDPRPISDGGDGFLAVLLHYRPDLLEARARVPDPLGRSIEAAWAWDPDRRTAWVESAAAVGLRLVERGERRPLDADSAGLGRLLLTIGGLGVRRLTVGLGGSATVDGGLGMARGLGFRFEDARGRPVRRPGELDRLSRITPPGGPPPLPSVVTALADVDHPLLGPGGAAAAFGPQKGATPAQVELLHRRLERLAQVYEESYEVDVRDVPGSGAAGGLAGGLLCAGAKLVPGFEVVADELDLDDRLDGVDLVITGEGFLDEQSFEGKVVGGVTELALANGIPVLAIVGEVLGGVAIPEGLEVVSLVATFGEERAFSATHACIAEVVRRRLG
jgi:glycerate kinase